MRTHQIRNTVPAHRIADMAAMSNAELRDRIAEEHVIDPEFDDDHYDLVGYSSTRFGHRYDA